MSRYAIELAEQDITFRSLDEKCDDHFLKQAFFKKSLD